MVNFRVSVALFAFWAALPGWATEWRLESSVEAPPGASQHIAVVSSESADHLRVFQDRFNTVYLSIRLRPGFERLDTTQCPSIEVLGANAMRAASAKACQIDAGGARLRLGQISDNRVRSRTLDALMRGHSIVLRMRLRDFGYRDATFTLKGSKQALTQMLGTEVQVVAAANDE